MVIKSIKSSIHRYRDKLRAIIAIIRNRYTWYVCLNPNPQNAEAHIQVLKSDIIRTSLEQALFELRQCEAISSIQYESVLTILYDRSFILSSITDNGHNVPCYQYECTSADDFNTLMNISIE